MKETELRIALECGHAFCGRCLRIGDEKSTKCPICSCAIGEVQQANITRKALEYLKKANLPDGFLQLVRETIEEKGLVDKPAYAPFFRSFYLLSSDVFVPIVAKE